MIRQASLDVLDAFVWFATLVTRPTLANYVGVPYDDRRLYRLAEGGYIRRTQDQDGEWVYQLTSKGLEAARGTSQDPPERWDRPWDGQWRILMFDMPRPSAKSRHRLWTWLRKHHFGCLQRSVWISPDSVRQSDIAAHAKVPGELIVFEGKPLNRRGLSDKDIAASAWDFTEINRRYEDYLAILDDYPGLRPSEKGENAFGDWKKRESEAWREVLQSDPLLPRRLIPAGYLGHNAWKKRTALQARIGAARIP